MWIFFFKPYLFSDSYPIQAKKSPNYCMKMPSPPIDDPGKMKTFLKLVIQLLPYYLYPSNKYSKRWTKTAKFYTYIIAYYSYHSVLKMEKCRYNKCAYEWLHDYLKGYNQRFMKKISSLRSAASFSLAVAYLAAAVAPKDPAEEWGKFSANSTNYTFFEFLRVHCYEFSSWIHWPWLMFRIFLNSDDESERGGTI